MQIHHLILELVVFHHAELQMVQQVVSFDVYVKLPGKCNDDKVLLSGCWLNPNWKIE